MIKIQIKEKVEHYYFDTEKTPLEIAYLLDISELEVLKYANKFVIALLKEKDVIQKSNTRKKWSEAEITFLKEFQNELKVSEASLILRRSRYGTYLKIRQLGLKNMIS